MEKIRDHLTCIIIQYVCGIFDNFSLKFWKSTKFSKICNFPTDIIRFIFSLVNNKLIIPVLIVGKIAFHDIRVFIWLQNFKKMILRINQNNIWHISSAKITLRYSKKKKLNNYWQHRTLFCFEIVYNMKIK